MNLKSFTIGTGIVIGSIIASGAITPTHAATIYTDVTSFTNNLQPGFYLNDFESLPVGGTGTARQFFVRNGFAYSIATNLQTEISVRPPLGVTSQALSTISPTYEMVIDITSNNVTAIGGNFFASSGSNPIAGNLTINLSDGTTESFSNTARNIPFRGFTTTGGTLITSLVLFPRSIAEIGPWNTMDNIYVGQAIPSTAVPEPFTVIGTLVGGTAAVRMRKRLQANKRG